MKVKAKLNVNKGFTKSRFTPGAEYDVEPLDNGHKSKVFLIDDNGLIYKLRENSLHKRFYILD